MIEVHGIATGNTDCTSDEYRDKDGNGIRRDYIQGVLL